MKVPLRPSLKNSQERGIVLMITMWALVLLIIMATQFAYSMRMELQITKNYKDELQLYYLAYGALQLAIAEILMPYTATTISSDGQIIFIRDESDLPQEQNQDGLNTYSTMWEGLTSENNEDYKAGLEQFIAHRSQFQLMNNGILSYTITDEDGKLNINSLVVRDAVREKNVELFRRLLMETGVPEGLELDTLTDSLLDWLDSDDLHRGNGAESDWYEKNYKDQGMSAPYKCKNGHLNTIEELLLIQGFTPQILYGADVVPELLDPEKGEKIAFTGLAQHVTVFTPPGTSFTNINQNTASDLVLNIIDPENVQDSVEKRRTNGLISNRRPSRYFTIQATGYLPKQKVSRTLKAVVYKSNPRQASRIEVRYWKDSAKYIRPGDKLFLDFETGDFIIRND